MRRAHAARPEPTDRPDPEPGVTVLRSDRPAPAALAGLATDWLARDPGPAYWVDAGGAADTRRLYDAAPTRRTLAGLRVARAFTAYQHAELLGRLPRVAAPDTRLVVVANAARPYREGDAPSDEATRLRRAGGAVLGELAAALGCPVLVSVAGDGDHATAVADAADRVVDCEPTPFGTRFDAPGHDPHGYRVAGGWQTTIPYWVDLFGAVADDADTAATPAESAAAAVAGALSTTAGGDGGR
ncbi:hypothetical protein [Halobaculum lipolyticum]|uniref:SGNH/GDSL hydrolase family protein n=1 Tax=Halobaculum lipolyticum TaxID=3032001 RepID=A0ABD5W7I4_9EURY|nr:hypothetical protein [Halobaculum sp. DT31]